MGFEPTCRLITDKTISSRSRYDHFDTSPYMLTRHTEINAIFSCIRTPVRTEGFVMTGRCLKTARLKAFWNIDFRLAKKISSAPRYDHFDTSPCVFQSAFSSIKFRSKNFWREKQERTLRNIRFLKSCPCSYVLYHKGKILSILLIETISMANGVN